MVDLVAVGVGLRESDHERWEDGVFAVLANCFEVGFISPEDKFDPR